jgi:hypothetical protein
MSYAIELIEWEDDNGYEYTGHSQLVDLGEYLIEPTEEEGILITTLDKSKCLKFKSLTFK